MSLFNGRVINHMTTGAAGGGWLPRGVPGPGLLQPEALGRGPLELILTDKQASQREGGHSGRGGGSGWEGLEP